ncbi:hypothetical protein CBR_g68696 [Chara braunii]|uniref:CCHC-type domain-containing protein n=1 Tax=Chara braunii TaxID=69332 RepID=A0A388K9H5_CHABU|nr:hypothetical protein CBR_g68696 [Chara braunii]|eukprot:GBG66712.1 hypothetical protein CBR_g68696 [Chara braunii]
MADGGRRLVTIDDLIDALDKRERAPSNIPKVETFHFKRDRVSDWLDLTEQVLVGLSDEVKLQRVLRYVLHSHHREVSKVVDAAGGSWTKFGDPMRRKYRLGDGLLTMANLEAMNKEDFSTIGAFVHEFKEKARKVHGISEEAQCATFLGLLTGSEATELTKYGEGSERLTWATIDKGVEEGSLDQVEQHQMRLQRRKRKERDATASGTPGVKRIVTDVLAVLGYDNEAEIQKRGVLMAQGRASGAVDEEAGQEDYGGGETGSQTRGQSKATASQGPGQAPGRAPPRMEPEPERRKEVVEVQEEEEEGDDEGDERLRQEEDQRAEQRAKKRGIQGGAKPSLHDGVPKRKKYAVRLEEGFDVERMVDKLLEGHNDLMNLKDILASAPRLRGELKGRLSRRLVPNVHLSSTLPREIEWTEAGTRMDRKCVACMLVDLNVRDQPSIAMVDTGVEMNIIRERDTTMLGLEVDHSDHGVLHGANCKAIFCGTASNVMVEIGRVRARTCFFIMPDVDHPILLGRSFLCRTETLVFNTYERTMILALSDPTCGNYEIIKCRNTGPGSARNRLNLGSFTFKESEYARPRLRGEQEEEGTGEVLSLSLNDVNKAMEVVATHDMADPEPIKALREQVLENPQVGEVELIYLLPGRKRDPAMAQARTTSQPFLGEGLSRAPKGWSCRINDENEEELIIGEPGFLSPQERTLMVETMKRWHCAYAFNGDERGRLDVDKILMIRIHTVPHEPWNLRGERYPNPDEERKVVAYLDGKMRTYVADYSSGLYASPWFYFIKPNGTLRHMIRVMQTVSPHITQPYIDDLVVKGPKEKEEDEVMPGVRRFVWKHIQDIDQVLGLLEEHNTTASGPKSKHCMREATILGFVCNEKGQRPDVKKTDKILEWPVPFQSITDVRSFLGTCGFLRRFVKDFATETEHLRKMVRQDQEWVWGKDQEKVVERMKGEFKEGGLVLGAPNYEATEKKDFCCRDGPWANCLGRGPDSDRCGWEGEAAKGPERAAGGDEQHEPPRREPTPEFDDDNIEFFLDVYRDHAAQRGWSVAERIHHLKGIGRFEEPVAQICEEALTWPDVEAGMQRLRASPRGRDGMPIQLEEGNAKEFIPAYEHYMLNQGIAREEWVQALLIWTRGAERPVAKQIRERARDWEECQAQLRRAFGQPERERHEPRVERRRWSKRPREPAPREVGLARERRAPAQREDEPVGPALAEESFPACGLRAVEFRRITSEELRSSSPLPSAQELYISRETPFRSLAAHLDVSQWEALRLGEGSVELTGYVSLEEPLDLETETGRQDREEPLDPEMAAEQPDPVRPQGEEVITVGDDTPPCSPVSDPTQHSWSERIPERGSEEIPEFSPEATAMLEKEAEAEGQGVCERARVEAPLDLPWATHVTKSPVIEEPFPAELPLAVPCTNEGMGAEASNPEGQGPRVRRTLRETREEKSARVWVRLDEIHARQAEMEAAGIEPTPPVEPETSEQRIDELWARYESQRDAARQRSRETGQADEGAGELREMGDLGFSATRQAIERIDRRICETAEGPQRLSAPEHAPRLGELKVELGSWATEMDSGGPDSRQQQQQEVMSEPSAMVGSQPSGSCGDEAVVVIERAHKEGPRELDTPGCRPVSTTVRGGEGAEAIEPEPQGHMGLPSCHEVTTETIGTPSASRSHGRKKKTARWHDISCFWCKEEGHRAVDCPELLEDKAGG